jgi:septal ring factor EnvC (AmiA/AmiB activator)
VNNPPKSANEAVLAIELIRKKMLDHERELAVSRRRSTYLVREVSRVENDLKKLEQQSYSLMKRTSQNDEERQALQAESNETREKIEALKQIVVTRLRAFYFRARLSPDGALPLTDQNPVGDGKTTFFLRKVQEYDQNIVAQLREAEVRREAQVAAIDSLNSKGAELAKRLAQNKADLNRKLVSYKGSLREITRREKRASVTLTALSEEAERLDNVLALLTGAKASSATSQESSRATNDNEAGIGNPGYFYGDYQGEGLPSKLMMPMNGKVISKFGSTMLSFPQGRKFQRSSLRQHGIELKPKMDNSVDHTAKIKSVSAGLVRFIGVLPRYGRVLIIDHGSRDFTLYGGIGKTLVSLGAEVSTGEDVAYLDMNKSKLSPLYFEIRQNGVARDPLPFFE